VEDDEYRRMAAVEQTHWWYAATRELLQQLLTPALRPGGWFLDAGAGTGATGAWLETHGTLVAGDFEEQALRLYGEAHPASERVVSDVNRLPFADDSFDAALCVTVLCHQSIPDPTAAVAELARVVRPGGAVCLLEPVVRRLRLAHDRVTHTGRRFSRSDLRRHAVDAGLEVVRATGAYSFLVPPAAVKAVIERGRTSSDLDVQPGGLGGLLGAAARAERAVLRRVSMPVGLSVAVVARKPA
jgi:SAM-dependent methyltransferase